MGVPPYGGWVDQYGLRCPYALRYHGLVVHRTEGLLRWQGRQRLVLVVMTAGQLDSAAPTASVGGGSGWRCPAVGRRVSAVFTAAGGGSLGGGGFTAAASTTPAAPRLQWGLLLMWVSKRAAGVHMYVCDREVKVWSQMWAE